MLLLNTLITAIIQGFLLFFLVLLIWIFTGRKNNINIKLNEWIGIEKLNWSRRLIVLLILVLCLFTVIKLIDQVIIPDHLEERLLFYHIGISALLPSLIASFIQTALVEEVIFRGLIGKNLIRKSGFPIGNLLQSLFFGMYYLAFMSVTIGIGRALIIALLTAACSYLFGYINEKIAGGSILPGFIINGSASFIAYLFII
ncbi:MAG: CPBP family intramembrane metalloprotease [Sporolactobacillus sp.]|nr:CPBP family intramembrane metalloprotease [Sporolactobacillus sp.]